MSAAALSNIDARAETEFLGLAPFLRMSIAGVDLRPTAQLLLRRAEHAPGDANPWMNLSTAMMCLGLQDMGLAMQAQALALQRVFRLAAIEGPPRVRLLVLMAPGDLSANTPLDCLLEGGDIDLQFYYVSPGEPLTEAVPEHDALFVALSESEDNRELLASLQPVLSSWPKPVINAPQHIPSIGRVAASALLRDVPGLLMPPTVRTRRTDLESVAVGRARLADLLPGCDFPAIVRPVDSHGGHGLQKLHAQADIGPYLAGLEAHEFFVSPFIDYSDNAGLFRKYRIALVEGVPYACHMAVSSNWMVHYVNADMYADARKRDEEARFMACFGGFALRHRAALDAIHRRTQLDYVCIDCAEVSDGRLLVFEIDHAMVVHAMDPEELFPYKQEHMRRLSGAFRDFLLRLTSGGTPVTKTLAGAETAGANEPA